MQQKHKRNVANLSGINFCATCMSRQKKKKKRKQKTVDFLLSSQFISILGMVQNVKIKEQGRETNQLVKKNTQNIQFLRTTRQVPARPVLRGAACVHSLV